MESKKEVTQLDKGFDSKTREILKRQLPVHTRRGQGGTFTYHKGSDVIRLLNEAFGHSWSSERIEEREVDGQILILVALTVMTQSGDMVVHHGYGSADIAKKNGKVLNIGNVYKSAFTNALKKAAEQFGIGLGDDEDEEVDTKPAPRTSSAPPRQAGPPMRTQQSRPSMKTTGMPMGNRPPMNRPTSMPPRPSMPARKSMGGPVSAPPTNPAPMKTPDLGEQPISDTQKKALRNLATMKNQIESVLIKGALPQANKESFDQLLKKEAIEVIKYANSLPQG